MEKNLLGLPTRQYLDQTVVPILLEALASLAKERPKEPIDFLIKFLEKHKNEHDFTEPATSASDGTTATTTAVTAPPTATLSTT